MMEDIRPLLATVADRAATYLETLGDRPVAPAKREVDALVAFDEPLPEQPSDPAETFALLDRVGSPATVASAGGRYFGFVVGASHPAGIAANWLATAWDQNAGGSVLSATAARLEEIALDWLVEILDLPQGTAGGFVTCATLANFSGVVAARNALLTRHGWDARARGLFGAPEINVVVGDDVHVSVLKALSMAGMGMERVTRVPVDSQGRMIPEQLPRLDDRTLVCLQAGDVSTGDCDPATPLCRAAKAAGAWVHVDGAFGMWLRAAPRHAHLVEGYELADSWALDAHKWLNVPYDSGLILCRDAAALRNAFEVNAAYLQFPDSRQPNHYTPEFSRRARGVEVWAVLRSLGKAGVAEVVERNCSQARRFAQGLAEAGYEILNEVVSNQVLVAFGDDARTDRIIEGIQRDGTCWAAGTTWQGRKVLRISVSSIHTTNDDVELSLAAMLRAASATS